MATRKLRLLLLAYLRGGNLVRTDYPQGVRSVLREHLILTAVEAEVKARQSFEDNLVQMSIYGSHLNRASIKNTATEISRELHRMHQFGLMDLHVRLRKQAKGSVDALVKLYQSLQKTEFFDMIREQHYRINPEERPDA